MSRMTTAQAAKKLGVSKNVVRGMVRRGIFQDYGETRDGRIRHHRVLDRNEVIEFANTHVLDGRDWVEVTSGTSKVKRTHTRRQPETPAKPNPTAAPSNVTTGLQGSLMKELSEIRSQVNRLTKAWFGDE